MQGDDRAVTRIEAPQSGVHELAVGERTGVVGMRGRVDRAQLDLDRAPAPASQEVETSVDDEAMQPGVEPVGISESRQLPPGADERLLDRVARELGVPENESGGSVQPREGWVDEPREGVGITPLRAIDELSLVHCRLDGSRPRRSRSTAYDVARPRIVHRLTGHDR